MEEVKEPVMAPKRKLPPTYVITVPCKDEMDLIGSLIFQYSASLCSRGIVSLVLRKQLVSLLSLYFKFGYNREAKQLAAETFGIKIESINSMNLELKQEGYLVDDNMNKRIKHLNPELEDLSSFYKQTQDMDKRIVLINFHMDL